MKGMFRIEQSIEQGQQTYWSISTTKGNVVYLRSILISTNLYSTSLREIQLKYVLDKMHRRWTWTDHVDWMRTTYRSVFGLDVIAQCIWPFCFDSHLVDVCRRLSSIKWNSLRDVINSYRQCFLFIETNDVRLLSSSRIQNNRNDCCSLVNDDSSITCVTFDGCICRWHSLSTPVCVATIDWDPTRNPRRVDCSCLNWQWKARYR
jgi:hypothetical protein